MLILLVILVVLSSLSLPFSFQPLFATKVNADQERA